MRIDKDMRKKVKSQGVAGIYDIFTEELVLRISALKVASDMNTISRHQGAVEVLESLLKFKDEV